MADGEGSFMADTTAAGNNQHQISGLLPGTSYFVKIAAQNSAGVGTFTALQLVKVLEATPGRLNHFHPSNGHL